MTFIDQTPVRVADEPDLEEEASAVDSESVDPADLDLDSDTGDADHGVDAQSTHALFKGDEGGLELDERRALVVLLKNRFITSESHPREWRTIQTSTQEIRRRLNDLFLELVISPEREVAFKRSASGGGEFPTLLRDTAWQREETALLVYLRVKARSEQSRGEMHARVGRSELIEYLRENRPDSATNRVADDRRADRAIDALKSAGLLVRTDDDSAFRISPAIEPMLPVSTLISLLTWLNARTAVGADDDAGFQTSAVPIDALPTKGESA